MTKKGNTQGTSYTEKTTNNETANNNNMQEIEVTRTANEIDTIEININKNKK